MRITWISHTNITASETFIADTLNILNRFAKVQAISGQKRKGYHKFDGELELTGYNTDKELFIYKIIKRIFSIDIYNYLGRTKLYRKCNPLIMKFNPDIIWIDYGTSAVKAKIFLNKNPAIPYVIAVHGYDISAKFGCIHYKKEFTKIANKSAAIICASVHTKNLCILAGVDESLCKVIRYGLDPNQIKPINKYKTEHPSFIHFGRLVEKKNPLASLEAFKKVVVEYPNSTFTYIGDGHLKQELSNRIIKYELSENVKVVAAMKRSDALEIITNHWVFCQHSVTSTNGDQEGFALSPAEASLLEMPVISTFHNGIPEHVMNNKTGMLVREFDIPAMAKAMIFLAKNKEIRDEMGVLGRQNITKLCSIKKRSLELETLMTEIIRDKRDN